MKVIVLGLNHAGTVAARTLKRLNPKAEVVAYEKSDVISFLGCGIALWVKGEVKDPKGLFYATPEMLAGEGIDVHSSHEWIGIDAKAKTVKVKNLKTGEEFDDNYDKIVVATGSWPIMPPIPGIDLENIQICKNYYHAEKIKAANENKDIKNVVIVGAGYIGVELVDAFSAAGKNVTLIDFADRIMPNYFDKEATEIVEKRMKDAGVKIALGQQVSEFKGDNGKLKTVVTTKGSYEADYCVFSVGIASQTSMLDGVVDLNERKVIKTNDFMQTSNPDIYAIGDCAEIKSVITGANAQIALATTAVRTGIIAAINVINNNSLPQMGFTGANAISVFDYYMASAGYSAAACERFGIDFEQVYFSDNDRPEFMSNYKNVNLRVIWEKTSRKIIGVQVDSETNHTEIVHMFALGMQKGLTIDELPLVDMFFLPHFNKPYNYVTLAGLEALGLNYFKK